MFSLEGFMSIASILALLIAFAALVTVIPYPVARKKCQFGYRALCPFTPMSTITLLMVAGVVFLVGNVA